MMRHKGLAHRIARALRLGHPRVDCRLCEAEWIRSCADSRHARTLSDGKVNPAHVAQEQTMRRRVGLPGFIASLDGPGRFHVPTPPVYENTVPKGGTDER